MLVARESYHRFVAASLAPVLKLIQGWHAGPITFCLVQAVEQGQAATYNVLLRAIRYALKNGPQHFVHTPQLFSSRRLNFNEAVVL